VILVCSVFACVTLHELGHGVVARRFGVEVREIMLLPIGGVARLLREPSKAWHELLIAVAGPLVNAVIAAVIWVLTWATLGTAVLDPAVPTPSARGLVNWLFWANIGLAIFNMIPALPMDGGRVFRALLSLVIGRVRATEIAALVGQVLALGFIAVGFRHSLHGDPTSPLLIAIGLFVLFAAGQERVMVRMQQTLSALRAGEVCDPYAVVLAPSELLGAAIDNLLRSPQSHFGVLHGNRLVGTLSRDDAIAATDAGLNVYVAGVMRRDVVEIDAATPLDQVRTVIMERGGAPVAVTNAESYVGLIGLEDLARVASVASALERRGVTRAPVRARDSASWL
jgi:Zn-dependent protease/CBS domain-containing protein